MQGNGFIGRQLGQYELQAELGRGGTARVYCAYQARLRRHVAIKVIAADIATQPNFRQRFEQEAQAIAQLNHPNIVAVYDFGEEADLIYLAMQYVAGGTLKQRLGNPLPVSEAVSYTIQMARALHHAHLRGVIHRDVKPANMLVDADDPRHLLLSDFGIAKLVGHQDITGTGVTIGTPEYMAPEQAEGQPVAPCTDVYSLGIVLYEALAGQPPFTGATPVTVLYQQVHGLPPYIRGFNPDIPRELAQVIDTALAKRPEERFPSAEAFALALAPFTRLRGGRGIFAPVPAAPAALSAGEMKPHQPAAAWGAPTILPSPPATIAARTPPPLPPANGEGSLRPSGDEGTELRPSGKRPVNDVSLSPGQMVSVDELAHRDYPPLQDARSSGGDTPPGFLAGWEPSSEEDQMAALVGANASAAQRSRAQRGLGSPPKVDMPQRDVVTQLVLGLALVSLLIVFGLSWILLNASERQSAPNRLGVGSPSGHVTATAPVRVATHVTTSTPLPTPVASPTIAVPPSDIITDLYVTASLSLSCNPSTGLTQFSAKQKLYYMFCLNPQVNQSGNAEVRLVKDGMVLERTSVQAASSWAILYFYFDGTLSPGTYQAVAYWNGEAAQTMTFSVS